MSTYFAPFSSSKKGRIGAADPPDVHPPPATSPAPDTSPAVVDHRGFASRDRDSDHARPPAWTVGRVNACGASRSPKGAQGHRPGAGLRRPAGCAPTTSPQRGRQRRPGTTRVAEIVMDVATASAPRLGPPGPLSGGGRPSLGIAKAAGLGSGSGRGLAQRLGGRSPRDR